MKEIDNRNQNSGVGRITRERRKQIMEHGYTPEHDSGYKNNELLFCALAYLNAAIYGDSVGSEDWPFPAKTWKYDGKEASLEKAGAFIAAYLDVANYKRRHEFTDFELACGDALFSAFDPETISDKSAEHLKITSGKILEAARKELKKSGKYPSKEIYDRGFEAGKKYREQVDGKDD